MGNVLHSWSHLLYPFACVNVMGIRTRTSLAIYYLVFLFIHTLSFMNNQDIPVAGIHLLLWRGLGCYLFSL